MTRLQNDGGIMGGTEVRTVDKPGLEQFHYRRPWHLLVLVVLAAVIGTAAVMLSVRARLAADAAQADNIQTLRLRQLSTMTNNFIANSFQLVNAAAVGPCSLRGDRTAVRAMLTGLLVSRLERRVYGLGCFFAPGAFKNGLVYFGPYVSGRERRAGLSYQTNERRYRYDKLAWYAAGAVGKGQVIPFGPYLDDGAYFISFLKAFYDRNGYFAGVASVDAPATALTDLGRAILTPDDFAYAERDGHRVASFGGQRTQFASAKDISLPVALTKARLHLITNQASVLKAAQRTMVNGASAIASIWLVAFLMTVMLLRSWSSRRRNVALQIQQVVLENKLAVRAQVEAELRHAAYTDMLTGLPNRAFIVETLVEFLSRPGRAAALLLLINIDGFSMINDTLGRESGDIILTALAARLRECVVGGTIARGSGDEFFLLFQGANCNVDAAAKMVRQIFAAPVAVEARPIHLIASLGAVWIEAHYTQAEDILIDAEIAMYRAKVDSRGGLTLFESGMRRQLELDARLEHDLRRAIAADEFTVFYQPIIELQTRSIVSLEALVRWNRPGSGLASPLEFMPFAEAHGLVSAIDALVLQHVCARMHEFTAVAPEISIAVNCSIAQLTSADIVAFTLQQLQTHGIDPSHIKLEITETSIMRNAEYALQSLRELRAAGVLTVVDDFGTGYSSLSYLQKLPIAGMKIDQSFIAPLEHSSQAKAIVRSIIALADTLGLYTVAEGVETAGQLAILDQLGATQAQGYFFSRPVDGHAMRDLLPAARFSAAS